MTGEDEYVGKLVGNYRIISRLAGGGFGEVYLAEHITLPRQAAVKFLHTQLAVSEEQRQAFLREAKLLEELKHLYILPLYEVFVDHSGFGPCLIAEYAAGGSLRDRMRLGRLPLEEVRTILRQVGQALQHAHQHNIVHRDLKPENILFRQKDVREALLADFGIAVVLQESYEAYHGVKGTCAYMAPEQFHGEACAESDQYALGCLAYELCTGQRPITARVSGNKPMARLWAWAQSHQHDTPLLPSWFNPQLSLSEEMAILKALAKGRKDRHVSVEAFIDAFCSPASASSWQITLPEAWVIEAHANVLKEGAEQAREMYERAASIAPADERVASRKWEDYFIFVVRRYERALVACQPAILPGSREAQLSGKIYSNLGDILYGLKRYDEALAAYQKAIGLGGKDAQIYGIVGDMLYSRRRYEEALVSYQEAIRLGKGDARIYGNVGNILAGLRHYEEALHAYSEAIRLDATCSEFSYGQGQVLEQLRRDEEALASYEHTIHIEPDYLPAWYHKGLILLRLKRYLESLHSFDTVLQLDGQNAAALAGKADALYHLNRYEEALGCYLRVQRLDQDAIFDWNNVADTYYCLNFFKEALDAYHRALLRNPHDTRSHSGRGDALYSLQRTEEALAAYERAIQCDPRNASALYGKGAILTEWEKYREAIAAYDQAIQLSPTFADAYYGKGNALSGLKKYREALAAYEQAIRHDPVNVGAWYGRANVLMQLGRHVEARSAYEQALYYDRDDASLLKGDALFTLERYAEALDVYGRLTQLNPADPELYERCRDALIQLNRPDEAKRMERKARELRGYA